MNSRENRNARYNEGVNPANHTKADTARNRRKRECRLPSSFSPVFPVTEAKKDRCIPLNASRWESPAVLNASDREGGVYSLEPESSARIRAPASPQENSSRLNASLMVARNCKNAERKPLPKPLKNAASATNAPCCLLYVPVTDRRLPLSTMQALPEDEYSLPGYRDSTKTAGMMHSTLPVAEPEAQEP